MPKRLENSKRLPELRTAWVHIRTHQATLDSARRVAKQEGVSLFYFLERTIVARLESTYLQT